MTDATTIPPIDRNEMVGLATTEYRRLLELLRTLDQDHWNRRTVCPDWDVRQMVAHLLGAAEANASIRENMRQVRFGGRLAKERGVPDIDGINEIQVKARDHLTPDELMRRLEMIAPKAVKGRRRTPGLLRRMKVPSPLDEPLTLGDLVDVIYTRDQWLHRIDIAAAAERQPLLTEDHDRRIVADVVREWAELHGEPFRLELGGPAGGTYEAGEDGPSIEMDAIEFCLVLSGRSDKEIPLARPVLF